MPSAGEIARCASPYSTRAFRSRRTVLYVVLGSAFFVRSHSSAMVTGSVPAKKTSRMLRRLVVNFRPAGRILIDVEWTAKTVWWVRAVTAGVLVMLVAGRECRQRVHHETGPGHTQ